MKAHPRLAAAVLLAALLAACGRPGSREPEAPLPPAIRSLQVTRHAAQLAVNGDAEPWSRYWAEPDTVYADLSHTPGLAYSLLVGNNTFFPGGLPEGYDPQALMEWGKYPGLNFDLLHARGFTGKGAVVAYIDQYLTPHPEYDGENLHIFNHEGENLRSMHGPAVMTLLAGKDIGAAPEAEVYYFSRIPDADVQLHSAECLYRVLALNETLPEGEKISMVGFSSNISSGRSYEEEFREAVRACEEAGIMVWFCGDYGIASFLPMADKNDPDNLMEQYQRTSSPALTYVPAGGRTVACAFDPTVYYYDSCGGLSWTMPYALGLYAIALSIDPSLTKADIRDLARNTACMWQGDKRLVDPAGFTAAVLDRAGRSAEAEELRQAVRARQKYLYAVLDLQALSGEDLRAVLDALAWITEAKVLVADASRFADAPALYDAIRADAEERGGAPAGYQLFGEAPAPTDGSLPVWRLVLEPGEYAAFLREYRAAALTGEPDTLPQGVLFPPNRAGMAICDSSGSLGN